MAPVCPRAALYAHEAHRRAARGAVSTLFSRLNARSRCGILFFAGLPALQQLGLLPAGLLGPNPFVINAAKVKRA